MKCVMVIDQNLQLGMIANTAAVLAISIGKEVEGIVGEDIIDRDGILHRGITNANIPILRGDAEIIRALRTRLSQNGHGELYYVDFCDVAQKCKDYADYTALLAATPADELNYLGIAICGPDKQVNSLTGSLGLLR